METSCKSKRYSVFQSQRAVKGRLQAMEKEAHKKHEKQKDSNAKLQKQLQKDKEKLLKTKQRREVGDFCVKSILSM